MPNLTSHIAPNLVKFGIIWHMPDLKWSDYSPSILKILPYYIYQRGLSSWEPSSDLGYWERWVSCCWTIGGNYTLYNLGGGARGIILPKILPHFTIVQEYLHLLLYVTLDHCIPFQDMLCHNFHPLQDIFQHLGPVNLPIWVGSNQIQVGPDMVVIDQGRTDPI